MAEKKEKSSSEEKDLFEEVFGEDKELKNARKKLNEIAKKESESMNETIYPQNNEESLEEAEGTEENEEIEKGREVEEKNKGKKKAKKKREKKKDVEEKKVKETEKEEAIETEKEKETVEEETEEGGEAEELETEEREAGEKEKGIEAGKAETVKGMEKGEEGKGKQAESKKGKIVVAESREEIQPKLEFLRHGKENVFIGRKKSVYEKYSAEGGLFVGKVWENSSQKESVLLDSLNPHVVFVCGARGSGKSYVLGVIAEELALKNKYVGTVVVDPVGVFWSMRHENNEEKEKELLKEWGLSPQGLENIAVFIPKGMEKAVPAGTFDASFSIKPSMLLTQDWCLTFGIERFSPTGLLLEKALEKVEKGYITTDKERIRGTKDFSIDDIVFCLENDSEINSRDRGYKVDSIRALTSRFEAAKAWGIFDVRGTPLGELSRENQLTIIDTSFLDDNVTSLIIGILARRILAARKIATRREAAKRFSSDEEMLEIEIPPTWLVLDEAHTLIPSGNIRTAASDALIEYVKQGRRPGCSLVFATQQPSAIDTRVLSQLDIILVHKLVFNDDIKAVYKRTPALIPHKYKAGGFVRTLPVGNALTADRQEETSRAFVMKIRPRMSQHEGRETETLEAKTELSNEEVLKLICSIYWSRLKRDGKAKIDEIKRALNSMNAKYSSSVELEGVVGELREKGAESDEKGEFLLLEEKRAVPVPEQVEEKESEEEAEESEEIEEETAKVELLGFPLQISKQDAETKMRKKMGKLFGLLAGKERLIGISLKYAPVYRIEFNYFTQNNAFKQGVLFINSLSGEFIHFNKEFIESKGLRELYGLSEHQIKVLNFLTEANTAEQLSKKVFMDENRVKRAVKELVDKGLVKVVHLEGKTAYVLAASFDLPKSPLHPIHSSLQKLPLVKAETVLKEREKYSEKEVRELLKKIWEKIVITSVKEVYRPVYEGIAENIKTGKRKKIFIDGFSGQEIAF